MEVFVVTSLLELRELRHLLRAFPEMIFKFGYVCVSVEVLGIDCLGHSSFFKKILDGMAEDLHCVVPSIQRIDEVADLDESLKVLKGWAAEGTSDLQRGVVYTEEGYRKLGHAAQIVRANSAFADGRLADRLFLITKEAVSCANTGMDLFNNWNERRWLKFVCRLEVLELDIDYLLHCPVFM